MKPHRPLQLFTAVLLWSVLFSCATSTPPPVRIPPPDSLVGLFSGRDGDRGYGVEMEVRFFPGGTVHIHSLWEDDGNSYSETGIYTYSPSSGRLKIVFDPEVSSMEISSYVGGRPAAFYTGGIAMVRREEPVLPEKPIPLEALIGPWVMYYQFIGELEVELVEVTLDLKASGLFVETTRYFEADEDLVESGRYEIDRQTGLVEFYYSTNPDYGYTAYYDTRRKALYTFDGDYYRTE